MSFLLDTNIISELRKPVPAPELIDWMERVDEDSLFLSVLSFGEIQNGISRLEEGKKKQDLVVWYENLMEFYKDKIFPVSTEIAQRWGELNAECGKTGKALPIIDGLIAATASITGAILITRNVSDFKDTGIRILNPWQR